MPEMQARKAGGSIRWSVVIALLLTPDRESRRLALLLEALPAERRRHAIVDDCQGRAVGRRPHEAARSGATGRRVLLAEAACG